MNKYFTKYIPVEGEIEEGDYYFDGTLLNQKLSSESWRVGKSWRKVKLFLCSRDIQVGDKIKDEGDLSQEFELNNEYYLRLYKEKGCTNHFKVIGEISPDAISYVTEGQEFEESKVGRCFYGDTCPGGKVKIKGPCGHFH